MEVIIPLALLIVGLVIGFFVARFVYTKEGAIKANEQAERALKSLMAEQASHHLAQTRHSLELIQNQCEGLKKDLDSYEKLLAQDPENAEPRVPFFGEEATTYLRNNLKSNEQSRVQTTPGAQPRDFAKSGSGLFVGTSTPSAAEKE